MKTINFPSWFKYSLDDFVERNDEVWNYIYNIKTFSDIMDLYRCCIEEDEISQSLIEIIDQRFAEYSEGEVEEYLNSDKCTLHSFNTKFKKFLNHFEKRVSLSKVIKQDIEKIKKIKESLEKANNLYQELLEESLTQRGIERVTRNITDEIELINEMENAGLMWSRERKVSGYNNWYDTLINKAFSLYPKTFKYISQNKLGWDLGGCSGGY